MTQRALSKHSESTQRAREQSDFIILSDCQSLKYFVLFFIRFGLTPPPVIETLYQNSFLGLPLVGHMFFLCDSSVYYMNMNMDNGHGQEF